jgi:hypothetical protein
VQRNLRIRNCSTGSILNSAANTSKRGLAKTTARAQEYRKDRNGNSRNAKPASRRTDEWRAGPPLARFLNVKKPLPRLLRPQEGNREAVEFLSWGFKLIHMVLLTGIFAGQVHLNSQPTREA